VATAPPREVFGVSATAALFRRAALAAAALPTGEVFDSRLGSYYEDVDLAVRLRARGFRALLAPRARARHAGGASAGTLKARRVAWVYGNRYLVLAGLLRGGFLPRLPAIGWRDGKDLARAVAARRWEVAAGILAGWARAVRWLPAHLRRGEPALPLPLLARFREGA
jgi:GT2 family glycosyltransferase